MDVATLERGVSPVRRLYAALTSLDSPSGVHENLFSVEGSDYANMAGDPEPRFCEWAYDRLERRNLVSGLLGTVLRPSDAMRLAVSAGCSARQLAGLTPSSVLREALRAFGIEEPAVPLPVRDGLQEVERCARTLDQAINDTQPASLEDPTAEGRTPAIEVGRRGAERLLKVLCFFLWDSGYEPIMRRVVLEGLHGYKATEVGPDEWEDRLHGMDLGQFNYLLKAVSEEIRISGPRPIFLPREQEVWPRAAFAVMDALAAALQTAVHDTQTTGRFEPDSKRRMRLQHRAVEKVLSKFSAEPSELWRPRTIQFFRRIYDGHAVHHEAYDETGSLVRFYESSMLYDLHVPHLFVAPTNPSAVDFSCAKLRPEFSRSI